MDENEVEVVEEKSKFAQWWDERKAVRWLRDHPDVSLTLLGGVLSIAGAVVKIVADRKEYDDSVFVTANDDEIYKIPVKRMKTIKKSESTKEISSVD